MLGPVLFGGNEQADLFTAVAEMAKADSGSDVCLWGSKPADQSKAQKKPVCRPATPDYLANVQLHLDWLIRGATCPVQRCWGESQLQVRIFIVDLQ